MFPTRSSYLSRFRNLLSSSARQQVEALFKFRKTCGLLMKLVPKTELAPENGCIIDTKWKVGPLSYHACASEIGAAHTVHNAPMPELVIFDHIGFKGAACRTNLSFHFLGNFWNDRISSLIIVSGVWRFYRDEYYKGPYWDLGPGYYESFFAEKGPDDVVSSFQCIALT